MIEKQVSYKHKVYEQIKEDIIIGVYSEGEFLNERKLAESMGISRTPIREALQQLSNDGWLVNEPYKGSIVRSFTVEYVMNAQKVRKALEIVAVEDAITNINDESIEVLSNILDKQEYWLKDYNPKEFMILDRQFHESIYCLSENDILIDLLKNLNDIIRFFGIKVLMVPERNKTTLKEHRAILEGIKYKNVDMARDAMNYHLLKTSEAIYDYTKGKP